MVSFLLASLHCLQANDLTGLTCLTHLKLTIHKDDLMGNMEEALAALTGLHSLHVTPPLQVVLVPLDMITDAHYALKYCKVADLSTPVSQRLSCPSCSCSRCLA
jgi:hypothetical protein